MCEKAWSALWSCMCHMCVWEALSTSYIPGCCMCDRPDLCKAVWSMCVTGLIYIVKVYGLCVTGLVYIIKVYGLHIRQAQSTSQRSVGCMCNGSDLHRPDLHHKALGTVCVTGLNYIIKALWAHVLNRSDQQNQGSYITWCQYTLLISSGLVQVCNFCIFFILI
jgi:hypothetical protein